MRRSLNLYLYPSISPKQIKPVVNYINCSSSKKIAEVARLEKEVKSLHAAQVAAAKKTADDAIDGSAAAAAAGGQEEGKKTKSWYKFW